MVSLVLEAWYYAGVGGYGDADGVAQVGLGLCVHGVDGFGHDDDGGGLFPGRRGRLYGFLLLVYMLKS